MTAPSHPTGAEDVRDTQNWEQSLDNETQDPTPPWPERFRRLHPRRTQEAATAVELVGELRDSEQSR